jgi:hypothetical protein
LNGTVNIDINDSNTYRIDESTATISLSGFSIAGQNIGGGSFSTIKYNRKEDDENENDRYIYTLTNMSIYGKDAGKSVLINCTISNGAYERVGGGGTLSMDDDEWIYIGTMSGMMLDDPKLKYTNRVTSSVYFTMGCKTARSGRSQVSIPGRKYDVVHDYDCSSIKHDSAPVIKK